MGKITKEANFHFSVTRLNDLRNLVTLVWPPRYQNVDRIVKILA